MRKPSARVALARWIGLAAFGALLWGALVYKGGEHERLLASVPLGSGLSGLESARQSDIVTMVSVVEWIPSSPVAGKTHWSEFGTFRHKDLGYYDSWTLTPDQARSFTGVVLLHTDSGGFFTDSVVMGFTFVKGRLVKKDWGYLPG